MIDLSVLVAVANVLTRERGVTVQCSGSDAYCTRDKNTGHMVINVPLIDTPNEDIYVKLRGYIDHECGHAVSDMKIIESIDTQVERDFLNIVEDVSIERRMSQAYPGCGINLHNLAKSIFADDAYVQDLPEKLTGADYWRIVGQYVLLELRRWYCPELLDNRNKLQQQMTEILPGLAKNMAGVLSQPVPECTADNHVRAKEILAIIDEYLNQPPKGQKGKANAMKKARNKGVGASVDVAQQIQQAVNTEKGKPGVTAAADMSGGNTSVSSYHPSIMNAQSVNEACLASAMLRTQLEALLQARSLRREMPARVGKLDTRRLYRRAIGEDRLFRKLTEVHENNTEIILLCDASGSMDGSRKDVTDRALYAVMQSMQNIRGVKTALYHFETGHCVEVVPFGGRLSRNVALNPSGGTPCGEALFHVMQKFTPHAMRHIVIILTDGESHNPQVFKAAIATAGKLGIELVGIGIESTAIQKFLDVKDCCIINRLSQLTGELFRILRRKLGV